MKAPQVSAHPAAAPAGAAPAAASSPATRPWREHQASATGPRRARVALLGASGYAGQEFVRLALGHHGIEIVALVSRELAGRPASEMLPGLDAASVSLPDAIEPAALVPLLADGGYDTLVSCLPHGAFRALVAAHRALIDRTERVVDLSSDYRDGTEGFVYGLPEAFREGVSDARHVANPGCYPTAAALALLPALEARWLAGPVMVSALSGVSGAGRAAAFRTSFVELEGGASLYRAGTEHAHVPEMKRTFAALAGQAIEVGFAPQLVPMARGILLTANAPLVRPITPEQAHAAYAGRYATEAFVRLLDPGTWPETRAVRASNRCDVAVTTLHGGRTLLVTAAIDNLVKGAAGQAIQNLNLMLGWPEGQSLPTHGMPW